MAKGRVILAMSGGVDSSVSAALLREQGYDVVGLFMRTGASEPASCDTDKTPTKSRGCCSAVDADDARRVADHLGIPFYALNFAEPFRKIEDYFVDEYLRGRTPNPCVVCNTWLKFGKLWEYAQAANAEWIATGHYARVVRDRHGFAELHSASDASKDQSYFLSGIRKEMLDRVLFPIGELKKTDVREKADGLGLGVAHKPDSQEICFVPSGRYQDFLHRHRPESLSEAGTIVDQTGQAVGEHGGVAHFTIGQRKGLGLAVGEPRYVVAIRPENRQVVIGPRELLLESTLEAESVNWLAEEPTEPMECEVRIRHLHRAAPAQIHCLSSDRVRVEFQEPQSAVTPGQAVVFYRGTRVLGGGWIANREE